MEDPEALRELNENLAELKKSRRERLYAKHTHNYLEENL